MDLTARPATLDQTVSGGTEAVDALARDATLRRPVRSGLGVWSPDRRAVIGGSTVAHDESGGPSHRLMTCQQLTTAAV